MPREDKTYCIPHSALDLTLINNANASFTGISVADCVRQKLNPFREDLYFSSRDMFSKGISRYIALLFYSAEKYLQSVQTLLFLFRRIAILSLPKEKASWQLKALFGFCWITIHPLLPRPSGRSTGLTVVLNIIAIGGLSISFIPVATIWEPLLFDSRKIEKGGRKSWD